MLRRIQATLLALTAISLPLAAAQQTNPTIDRLVQGLDIDLKTAGSSDLGVDYSWDIWSDQLDENPFGKGPLNAHVHSEGFLGFKDDQAGNTQRVFSIQGDLDAAVATLQERGGDSPYDHRLFLGITPFRLEADQDFENVNYVFRGYATASLPYSHHLSRGVQSILGGDGNAPPPVYLNVAYAVVGELEDDSGNDADNRVEIMLRNRLPIGNKMQLYTDWRWFDEDGDNFDFFQFKASYPIDQHLGVFFKYTAGELPPLDRAADVSSIGLSWSF